jgi:hypothetical protein
MNRVSMWDDIIAETSARPLPLAEEQFRVWMGRQGIFVSSLMDDEMTPHRNAVRTYLRGAGATPLMWEEITPQDKGAQHAYLDGVDQSSVFVLMIGRRYGVADASGASPTHKEALRAAERNVPRLLFVLGGVDSRERDVKLNDWLASLYNEISGATFDSPETLVARLDAQLRETAAQNERPWIKLGNLVFPGKVKASTSPGGREFTVTARVSEGRVRHELMSLGAAFARNRPDRLTWSEYSYPIEVVSSASESEFTAEDSVEIRCRTPRNWYGESGSSVAIIGVDSRESWVQQAFFGIQPERRERRGGYDLERAFSKPDAKPLPEVLAAMNAGGWLAEGLTRLYVVEEVARRYGGHFERLEVGPATAQGVRVKGSFSAHSGGQETMKIEGIVPLRRG